MIKTTLITGSTSGIGKAFADKLAFEKYNLILVSRDAEKLSSQSIFLSEKYKIKTSILPLDLTKLDAAQKVYDAVYEMGLSIDLLINNAGFNEYGPFLKTNMQKEREMIHLHVIFATEMMKLFIPTMVKNGCGKILNLGSTGSYMPCPYDAVYAATKESIHFISF